MKPRPPRAPGGRRAFPSALAIDLGESGLFLGRYDEVALRHELDREGILQGMGARGYPEVVLRATREGGEHRLRILPPRGRTTLVDLRLYEATVLVEHEVLRRCGLEVLSVVWNSWLSLQDPRAQFTPERPRLPGQRHPGLGLARAFYGLLTRWAREFGKDALLATPEYFHNAVFYSPAFRFLSPVEQGCFEALRRDLDGLVVADASAAVAAGRVRERRSARPLVWRPGAMAAPLGRELVAALEGPAYARSVREALEQSRYDWREA